MFALEPHVGAGVGRPGRQFGAVEQHPVGAADAAPAVGDSVVILLVFRGQLFPGKVG